jgi:hypothetical protein
MESHTQPPNAEIVGSIPTAQPEAKSLLPRFVFAEEQ